MARITNAALLAELAALRTEVASLKAASPVKDLGTLKRCARPIPCDRVFTLKGTGADNHTCRGFTGTPNKRRLS